MKKLTALFIVIAFIFGLVGCYSPMQTVKVIDIPLTQESYAFAISKGNAALEKQVNEYIDEITKSGELDKIIESFFNGSNKFTYQNPSSKAGCFVVATNAYFPPFEYYNGNKFTGIDIYLAYNLANRIGKKLFVEDMDFNGVIPNVQNGSCDIAMAGLTINDERLQFVNFSKTYYESSQVLIVKSSDTRFDNCKTANEIENLLSKQSYNFTVGAQNGTTGYLYLKGDSAFGYSGFTNLKTIGYTTGALSIRDLVNGRIDAVLMDSQPAHAISGAINKILTYSKKKSKNHD